MQPVDSAVARATTTPAVPVAAVAVPVEAAPSSGVEAAPSSGEKEAENLWMPPWAQGPAPAARRGTRYAPQAAPDLETELERVRSSLDKVARERDLLRGHVKSMEKMVREQVGRSMTSDPAPLPPRPTSAPSQRRGGAGGSSSSMHEAGRQPGGSTGARSARRITKDGEQEMMRRIYGRCWKMDPNDGRSGVEQLKAKLDKEGARQLKMAKVKMQDESKYKVKKMSRSDIEQASAEMFARARQSREKLDRHIAKRQEEQAPAPKVSKSTALERAMRFQRLSMPVTKVQPAAAAGKWTPRGVTAPALGSSSGTMPGKPKTAWFAGTTREVDYQKRWKAGEILGPRASRTAVH